jgi:hypothetical protein
MSSDLLNYCLEQLLKRPRRLVIHQPLDSSTKISFTRGFAKARFEDQQLSIVRVHPDHPDYGKGTLLNYNLEWSEDHEDPAMWRLEITYSLDLSLSPREAILWASTNTHPIEVPFTKTIFNRTKDRMMGRESGRRGGRVLPALRPAIAGTFWETRGGHNYIKAWNMAEDVTTEN